MKENYIKKLYANRLADDKDKKQFKQYPAPQNLRELDFSLEQPDAMPDIFVIDKLYQEASKWENRGYGTKAEEIFNDSAITYLNNYYNTCSLNRDEEISVTNGTIGAFNILCLAFINAADSALITKPCVTSLETMTKWLGGTVVPLPISTKSYPKFEEIPQKSLKKAKLLYLSYPNNPTGASATVEFFKEAISFAKTNNLIIVHDASYAALVYEESRRLSFLSIEGAKKVGVELHSFSHAFNMAGWRIGFIAGNKSVIRAYKDIRKKGSIGQYTPIQQAAAYALNHTDTAAKTAQKYERRMEMLCAELEKLGFKFKKPKAGFYLFVRPPRGVEGGAEFATPFDFELYLRGKNVLVRAFDEGIRFSVTFSAFGEQEEYLVVSEMYERLKDEKFVF